MSLLWSSVAHENTLCDVSSAWLLQVKRELLCETLKKNALHIPRLLSNHRQRVSGTPSVFPLLFPSMNFTVRGFIDSPLEVISVSCLSFQSKFFRAKIVPD